MKIYNIFAFASILVVMLTITGCAETPSSADVYSADQAQLEQTVRSGTVESVRAVTISSNNGQPSGIGAVGVGALGALAGSTIGGGKGAIASAIIGGIGGAVAGNALENGIAKRAGVEITVRLDNGELLAVTQAATAEVFRAGDRVRLLRSGGVTRVTR